jgi:proteasome lid subunit RPN8/RPN11
MIHISEEDFAALRAHGEETYPHECCGVLLGKSEAGIGNRVSLIVRAGNTSTDSAHNHSHPDHPSQWSQTDFAEAHWMGCSYVITSVEKGKAVLTNSFLLTGTSEENKAFEVEDVVVETPEVELAGKERGNA